MRSTTHSSKLPAEIIKPDINGESRSGKSREIYEHVLGMPSTAVVTANVEIDSQPRKKSKRKEIYNHLSASQLLSAAENGDLQTLILAANHGEDLSSLSDSFGWTCLHVAVVGQQTHIVKWLLFELNLSLDSINQQDRTGNTSLNLAEKNCYVHMVQMLQSAIDLRSSKKSHVEILSETLITDKSEDTLIFCEICKVEANQDHPHSIGHIFACQHRVPFSPFLLPKSNIGYKIMKKSGWNDEHGLGLHGDGKMLPVKTILKRDKSGLGIPTKEVKRITHFGPFDDSSVKVLAPCLPQKIAHVAAIMAKEKAKEKNIRAYLNS